MPSQPHPIVMATVRASPKDHEDFNFSIKNKSNLKEVHIPMVPESGCQSMIAPLQTMYAMGLKKSDLIPAKMAMTSAGGNSLEICGIAVWVISVRDEAGHMLSTKQL